MSASGDLRAADPLGLAVKGRVSWTPSGQPNWTVAGSARGDLNALNIVAHTTSPFRADISGQALDLTDRWHWVGDALVQDFNLSAWGINGPLGSISGHLAGTGDDRRLQRARAAEPGGPARRGIRDAVRGQLRPSRADCHAHAGAASSLGGAGQRRGHHRHRRQRPPARSGRPLERLSLAAHRARPCGAQPRRLVHARRHPAVPGAPHRQRRHAGARRQCRSRSPARSARTASFSMPAEIDLFGGHASLSGGLRGRRSDSWSSPGHLTEHRPGPDCGPTCPATSVSTLSASGPRLRQPAANLSATLAT